MEDPENENYTCPYCKWTHSHSWSHFREEEDLIESKYLGQDLNKTYWLETKKKFKVKICSKCDRNLKIRRWIIGILLFMYTGFILVGILGIVTNWIFQSPMIDKIGMYFFSIGLFLGFVLFMFWILWKVLGPSRAHVNFERSRKYNALVYFEMKNPL